MDQDRPVKDAEPDRRRILRLGVATLATGLAAWPDLAPAQARPAGPVSALGVDGTQLGLRPGSPDDQSAALQRALDRTTADGRPLALAPGVYRVGGVELANGATLVATPGTVRLLLTAGPSLLSARNAERVTLSGLVLDGRRRTLPEGRGLLQAEAVATILVRDCEILGSGRHGIALERSGGEVTGTTIARAAGVAILSRDAGGLAVSRNTIRDAGDNGVQILRSQTGEDGTLVTDNRIEGVTARSGGNGPYGNAVNVFRAGGVIVRGNRIIDCAFSAVRGNAASNLQITGNTVTRAGETALYAEFGFEGAVISGNIVDGAQTGISVTNFSDGGRLAVVQGNLLRDLAPGTSNPDAAFLLGVGIYVEADTAVTGNVVENARAVGIAAGWGRHLRDVAITGNVVRGCGIGIGVSVAAGAGAVLIDGNLTSGSERGAIVGLDHKTAVTGDLARGGSTSYTHLSLGRNRAE